MEIKMTVPTPKQVYDEIYYRVNRLSIAKMAMKLMPKKEEKKE